MSWRYTWKNFDSALSAFTATKELRCSGAAIGSASNQVAAVPGGSSDLHSFIAWSDTTAPYSDADWPTTNWGMSIDVSGTGADLTYKLTANRVSSSGVDARAVHIVGFDVFLHKELLTGQSGTGIKAVTSATIADINSDGARASTDRVGSSVLVTNSNMMTGQNLTIIAEDADTWIENTTVTTPTITCQLITASSTLFNPTVVPVQKINFNVLVASTTVFNPTVQQLQTVTVQLLVAPSTLLSPTVNQDIALQVVNSITTLFEPSLDYNVVFPTIAAPETVFEPFTDTSVNIEHQLITTSTSLFEPTFNQDIQMAVLTASETVLNPAISSAGGEQDISFVLITAASTVFETTVTTLNTVSMMLLETSSTLFSPSLVYVVEVPTIVTTTSVLTPSTEYIVQMQVINTTPTLHTPRIGEVVDDGFSGAIVRGPQTSPFPIGIN